MDSQIDRNTNRKIDKQTEEAGRQKDRQRNREGRFVLYKRQTVGQMHKQCGLVGAECLDDWFIC